MDMQTLNYTYRAIILVIFLMLISCGKEENKQPEPPKYGSMKGLIQNEFGQPINGALVKVGTLSTKSSPLGNYLFEKIEINDYSVSVSKEYFLTDIKQIKVSENEKVNLDFVLITGDVFLDISDSIINLSVQGSSFYVEISSNAAWTVQHTSLWIDHPIENGKGNSSIVFSFPTNQEDTNRIDTIYFTSGSLKKKLVINQHAQMKIIKYEGLLGNREENIIDSIYVLFNKPIERVNSIISGWKMCDCELNYTLTDNNHGLKFSYSCARLGGSFPFSISVIDNDGYLYGENINVTFYKSKLDIEGFVTDFLLINNDKEVLISAFLPSKLIRYSIELDLVTQIIDLSQHISPMKLSYNPYNSKVYIMGANPDVDWRFANIDRPDIYTIDLQTNEIIKAITIKPDEKDHPQSPANIPRNIGFTKSGMGIVLLGANMSSALRWKLIDCKNDSIYSHPSINDIDIDFDNVHMNYDNTKLYLTRPYGSCDYGIFDGFTKQISILYPGSATRGSRITPYRKGDKFYAQQLYDQFIIDLDGNMSQISYLNSPGGRSDFSYRENDTNIIYYCEGQGVVGSPSAFHVLDYNIGKTLMFCYLVEGIGNFTTTIDGNYGVAFKQNVDVSSSLFVFETEHFHRISK